MNLYDYTLKDSFGLHCKFTTWDGHRNMREALAHAESRLVGSFSGGEVVSISRKWRPKQKFAPIPQDHRPREIGDDTTGDEPK